MSKLSAPRGTIIHQTDKRHRRIKINVGGEQHSPYVSTLRNIPDCPLAWIIRDEFRKELDYDSEQDVYFFDRHPGIFSQVLSYFQTGKLHCPRDVCGPMFQEELNFWGIDETQMEACCWPNYAAHRETLENLKMFHIIGNKLHGAHAHDEKIPNQSERRGQVTSGESKWRRYQRKIWEVLDEPYSSNLAKVFAFISLGFIVLSIITYSLITLEEIKFKQTECSTNVYPTAIINISLSTNMTNDTTAKVLAVCSEKTPVVAILRGFEMLFAVWFTLEIVLRFTFCPDTMDFIRTFSNWVDLLAVVPVYLLLLVSGNPEILMMLNMIRYLRVFRLFKFIYDLQILAKTLQASMHQLLILLVILCVPTIIFSSIVYYAEIFGGTEKSKEDFSEIQKGMWWSVITMTTVGYGKVVPASIPGKIVGAAASVIGIIIVSMTASVIGCNFEQYYSVAITQLQIPAKNSTAIKIIGGKNTLLAILRREEGKSASIKSDDSKDSGYGRSPIPPGESDTTSSPSLKTHGPQPDSPSFSPPVVGRRERNVIIAIDQNGMIDTTQV